VNSSDRLVLGGGVCTMCHRL